MNSVILQSVAFRQPAAFRGKINPAGCGCSVGAPQNQPTMPSGQLGPSSSYTSRWFQRPQQSYAAYPAGQIDYGYGTPGSIYGPGGNSTNLTVTYDPNQASTPSTTSSLLALGGSLLNTTGATIAAWINSDNQLQLARLNQSTQEYIANLRSQGLGGGQDAQQAALLQALLARATAPQNNTMLYVGIGAAVLALGVIAFIATRPRRNPVVRRHGRRKFVSASHYRMGRR